MWLPLPALPRLDRRFATVLGLSLALHAWLLAGNGWQRPVTPPLPTILASIRQIEVTESGPHPAAAAVATTPARPVEAAPQKARQSLPVPAQRAASTPVPAAGPANPSVPSPVPPAGGPTSAGPVVTGEALPKSPAVVAESASESAAAARHQGDLLAAYRQRVSDLLARQQEYPRVAAMRGWEGEVRLRLRVARKGSLLGIQLDHSSGFEVLDQHAVSMLERLAGLPALPDALEANEIQVVVPINYKLKKTT
ncbi:MAG: energy transducer TonB [Rhodocyclales bacterium GT-UBC]|nr:MAG: energy transducer TonB [Rhodocyclales bacterium GT-UBC]